MKETMRTFVKSQGNSLAVEAMERLREPQHCATKLFIEGIGKSGKSALARSWAEDATAISKNTTFACSGADIAMALQFEADDSFFERLGSTPILIIDDLEPLMRAEKGDQLLSLMLIERERQNFSTVITSRKPLNDYAFADSNKLMQSFKVIEMKPLNEKDKQEFVRIAFSEYATAASPTLEDAATARIVTITQGNFTDMENAAHYLATDKDCAELGNITAETVEKLLNCA